MVSVQRTPPNKRRPSAPPPPPRPTTERPDDLAKLTELAKGAVDTAVGLGVLGLQKLQVGRVELQKRLANTTPSAPPTRAPLRGDPPGSQVDALFAEAIRTVESTLTR